MDDSGGKAPPREKHFASRPKHKYQACLKNISVAGSLLTTTAKGPLATVCFIVGREMRRINHTETLIVSMLWQKMGKLCIAKMLRLMSPPANTGMPLLEA